MQFEWLAEQTERCYVNRKKRLSSREMKGTWCVVLCNPKGYAATEVAHHSRFANFKGLFENKNAKSTSVMFEKHLILGS